MLVIIRDTQIFRVNTTLAVFKLSSDSKYINMEMVNTFSGQNMDGIDKDTYL